MQPREDLGDNFQRFVTSVFCKGWRFEFQEEPTAEVIECLKEPASDFRLHVDCQFSELLSVFAIGLAVEYGANRHAELEETWLAPFRDWRSRLRLDDRDPGSNPLGIMIALRWSMTIGESEADRVAFLIRWNGKVGARSEVRDRNANDGTDFPDRPFNGAPLLRIPDRERDHFLSLVVEPFLMGQELRLANRDLPAALKSADPTFLALPVVFGTFLARRIPNEDTVFFVETALLDAVSVLYLHEVEMNFLDFAVEAVATIKTGLEAHFRTKRVGFRSVHSWASNMKRHWDRSDLVPVGIVAAELAASQLMYPEQL